MWYNTFHGDAQALVIPFPYRALGQPCWLWATGELDDGTPYHFDVLEGEPLAEEWLHDGVSAVLSRHELQKLADCSGLSVHFAVNFNGQVDLASAERFPVLHLELEQEALVLDAPRVLEAVGQDLTIWNGRDGVTVRVEYAHISSGQMISLDWIRSDGTRLPLAPEPGNRVRGRSVSRWRRRSMANSLWWPARPVWRGSARSAPWRGPGWPVRVRPGGC